MLEEQGLDCEIEAVNLKTGEQKSRGHLAVDPNGKIPAPEGRADVSALAWTFRQVGILAL
mgnify:FL=1